MRFIADICPPGPAETVITMRFAIRALSVLLSSLLLVAGCGQKGPLFLPGDPSTIQTDVPAQSQPQTNIVDRDADDDPDEDDEE